MGTANEVSKRIQNSSSIEPPKRASVCSAVLAVARGVAALVGGEPEVGTEGESEPPLAIAEGVAAAEQPPIAARATEGPPHAPASKPRARRRGPDADDLPRLFGEVDE